MHIDFLIILYKHIFSYQEYRRLVILNCKLMTSLFLELEAKKQRIQSHKFCNLLILLFGSNKLLNTVK
jgi:hypothetical protein